GKKKRKRKKKMKREHPETKEDGCSSKCPKSMWDDGDQGNSGMDELLAVLGYKVKSSEMADVAQKLEQLEMAMGTVQDDGISHLSCDTIHYNPSDISGWLESMLSEINTDPITTSSSIHGNPIPGHHQSSSIASASSVACAPHPRIFEDNSEYDLRLIPGIAAYNPSDSTTVYSNKRTKHHDNPQISGPSVNSAARVTGSEPEPTRPLVLFDSQDTGVRLVHTLMACAEAVHSDNLKLADTFLKQIGLLAVSQVGAMRKVATYFAEALARRIYKICPQPSSVDSSYSDVLLMHFYQTCPYLKFAHLTANQAIFDAFAGADRVHVIDFSMKQGMQWPALMQDLAVRPGGPPVFTLTAIGPPQTDNTDALQQVGWKLAQFADHVGVEFHYRGFVCDSLADLDAAMLDIKQRGPVGETVAVNSVFELHRLLARPGAIEKVLATVRAVKPKIVTVVEQEANHNGPVFLERFNEALYYYSAMFDSLEACGLRLSNSRDIVMSGAYLGRQICNVVSCEGEERVERHESMGQWRARMESSGFEPVHLGSNAFKKSRMLLGFVAGCDGYRVEENSGCLMLGWYTRPLIATSAWRLASAAR
ncbi:hypothetical protein Dimus_014535, partial [Dionaea muscipula]